MEFNEKNTFALSLVLLKGTELKTKPGCDYGVKFLCLPMFQAPREQLKVATLIVYSLKPLPYTRVPCVFECSAVYVANVKKATKGVPDFLDSRLCLIASQSRVCSKWKLESLANKSPTHYLLSSPCFKQMMGSVYSKK